jgi:hypothetical protein
MSTPHRRAQPAASEPTPVPQNCDVITATAVRTSIVRSRRYFYRVSDPCPFGLSGTEPNRVAYQDPVISKVVAHLDLMSIPFVRNTTVATGRKSDYQTDTEHTLHKGIWDQEEDMTKGNIWRFLSSSLSRYVCIARAS